MKKFVFLLTKLLEMKAKGVFFKKRRTLCVYPKFLQQNEKVPQIMFRYSFLIQFSFYLDFKKRGKLFFGG